MIEVEYDSKVDSLHLWLKKTKNFVSEEIENVIIEKDENNHIIGMEILKASETSKNLSGLLETIEIMQNKKLMKDRDVNSKNINKGKTASLDKILKELKRKDYIRPPESGT